MAESVVATLKKFYQDDDTSNVLTGLQLTWTVTAAADGSITDTPTSTAHTALISGWFLDKVTCNPGATAPTANSDVYILDADGVDLLGGNGVDLLHSSTSYATIPATDGQNKRQLMTGIITLDVDNNSAANSTYTVVLDFVR